MILVAVGRWSANSSRSLSRRRCFGVDRPVQEPVLEHRPGCDALRCRRAAARRGSRFSTRLVAPEFLQPCEASDRPVLHPRFPQPHDQARARRLRNLARFSASSSRPNTHRLDETNRERAMGVRRCRALPAPVSRPGSTAAAGGPRRHQLEMVERGQGRPPRPADRPHRRRQDPGRFPAQPDRPDRAPPRPTAPRGVHTLYISPLKALAVDIERNLGRPIAEMGLPIAHREPHRRHRRRQAPAPEAAAARHPADHARAAGPVLRLGGRASLFRGPAQRWSSTRSTPSHGSKRGDLLNLGLARLQQLAPGVRRVGLSATVNDPDMLRRWLAPQPGQTGRPGAGRARARAPIVEVLHLEAAASRGAAGPPSTPWPRSMTGIKQATAPR